MSKWILFASLLLLGGCLDRSKVERKIELAIGSELPTEYKIETNDWFAGPGDFAERYEIIFSDNGFKEFERRVDISIWKPSPSGSGYERQVQVEGQKVLLYSLPEQNTLIYVRPEN